MADENYNRTFSVLVTGKNAGVAEQKAIKIAKQADSELARGERKHKPYVRGIQLIGELEG